MTTEDQVPTFKQAKRDFEVAYVTRLLEHFDGHVTRAAEAAKTDRRAFYALMYRAGVSPNDFRPPRKRRSSVPPSRKVDLCYSREGSTSPTTRPARPPNQEENPR